MKKIFISGASEGIGLAVARRFYESGAYQVSICARKQAGLDRAKAEMPRIQTYACDISDKQSLKKLVDQINAEQGPLDILVNNGGTYLPGQLHSEDDAVMENLMDTNLFSAYYLTKGVLPAMIARGRGTVINMCSIASITPYPNGGAYSVSKYALYGFSECLREEMKPKGIRVVAVLPGGTYTNSWAGSNVPEDRLMPASDIAELVWTACHLSDRSVVENIVVRPQLGDL